MRREYSDITRKHGEMAERYNEGARKYNEMADKYAMLFKYVQICEGEKGGESGREK